MEDGGMVNHILAFLNRNLDLTKRKIIDQLVWQYRFKKPTNSPGIFNDA